MTNTRYEEMRPAELAEAREKASLVYVPIGSTEYHGWHLPVGFDAMHAYELCLRAAEQTGGVVLPATHWGTQGHEGYAGSLLLAKETIANLMRDVLERLADQQYRPIVICTGHYPRVQGELLKEVAAKHTGSYPDTRVLVLDPFNLHPTDQHAEHAGKIETSVMLYLRPDLVDMDQLRHPDALKAISEDCVKATREYGQERFESVLVEMVGVVRTALGEVR